VLGNRVVWVAVNSEERVIDACRTSRDGQGRCIVGAGAASSWTPSRPVAAAVRMGIRVGWVDSNGDYLALVSH
jgi:hypothetical protein